MSYACPCPTCRRVRELQGKRARAIQLLEGDEGFLLLNVFDGAGGTSTIRVESEDSEGLEEAVAMLDEEIASAERRVQTFGHGRGRRRRFRSRFMER